jgi:small subunit ribosomal protein S17
MADQQTVEQRAAERAARKQKNARARRAYRAKQKAKRAETRAAAPPVEPDVREHGPGRPKVRQGIVVSAKPDKTITVRIDVTRRHRVYKKIIRSSSTLHVHDERNDANEGDLVRVVESRPISRLKRWRLVEVLERSR